MIRTPPGNARGLNFLTHQSVAISRSTAQHAICQTSIPDLSFLQVDTCVDPVRGTENGLDASMPMEQRQMLYGNAKPAALIGTLYHKHKGI